MRTRGRRAQLALSRDVGAAAVLGVGRPIVAVAPALLSHVQRRDDLGGIAHAIVRVIAGWHPAVWWLERRMLIEREIACDETAVAVTGCPKRYAACLTTIAGLPTAAIEQVGAMGVLSTPALSRRVMRILSSRTLASRAWSASAALIAILLLSAFSFGLAGHRLVEVTEAAATNSEGMASSAAPPEPVASAFRRKAAAGAARPPDQPRLKLRRSAEALAKAEGGSHAIALVQPSRRTIRETTGPGSMARTSQPAATAGHSVVTAPLAYRSAKREGGALVPVAAPMPSLPAIDKPALLSSRVQVSDSRSSPWAAIADGGVSVGRGSRQAGVATARFFTRFGKKIAGSL
jgi:hypothetical protein